jgi:hypothetical protein
MRDYDIKPPSQLFGALKVTIEFNTVVISPEFNLQPLSNLPDAALARLY